MHKKLLLIDENYQYLGHDKKTWLDKINKQIQDYYTCNGFCDSARISGDNVLFCKPNTGLWNNDGRLETAPETIIVRRDVPADIIDGVQCYCEENIELKNNCHVCEIKDLTKINDKEISWIEFTDGEIPTLEEQTKEFNQYIDKLNKKQIQGVAIILDIHY